MTKVVFTPYRETESKATTTDGSSWSETCPGDCHGSCIAPVWVSPVKSTWRWMIIQHWGFNAHTQTKKTYIYIHMYMIQSPGRMLWRSPAAGPIQQPWISPKLVMDMPFHSGIWCCTQFLTASTFCSAQITEVRIVTHLLGLRVMPKRNMYIFI